MLPSLEHGMHAIIENIKDRSSFAEKLKVMLQNMQSFKNNCEFTKVHYKLLNQTVSLCHIPKDHHMVSLVLFWGLFI